jgi:predicted transcriptional regulator
MQSEIELLLGSAIDSLAKLELLFYMHQRPGAAQSAEEIASRVQRRAVEVAAALKQLSDVGLVERFALGSGRHVVYGAAEDAHVRELLGLLHDQYHGDSETRARIIQRALRRGQRTPPSGGEAL